MTTAHRIHARRAGASESHTAAITPIVSVEYNVNRDGHGFMQTKLIMDATRPTPPAYFPPVAKVPAEVVDRISDDQRDQRLTPALVGALGRLYRQPAVENRARVGDRTAGARAFLASVDNLADA